MPAQTQQHTEMENAPTDPTTAAIASTTTTTSTHPDTQTPSQSQPLSKRAQKKLLKQQRYEAKKEEKKRLAKEQKRMEKERKQKEWEEKLSNVGCEEDKLKLIESRRGLRKERMEKRSEEREKKMERLNWGKLHGQNIVVDLEFSHLMSPSELTSLVQQIMYCYAVNGRCQYPSHLWLTGCEGDMGSQLKRLPGFDKWIIEKENRSYIEAFQEQKENLVYLTADAETTLDDLDPKKIYIIGGLVDRNRWKGITMKKAQEQGIQAARLPIGNYLKMSSSQVLTVNQVVEILLKYIEIRDWKASFFQVIPQRKRSEAESGDNDKDLEDEMMDKDNRVETQKKMKLPEIELESTDREVRCDERMGEDGDPEASEREITYDNGEKDYNSSMSTLKEEVH